MLSRKESKVFRFAELGIAKRLGLIVLSGVLALLTLAVAAQIGQRNLTAQAENVRNLEAGMAALNHLDTRQSELKVDAYLSALGQDVSGDVADDVQSATDAADAMEAVDMPAGLHAEFATVRPDVDAFGAFIRDFVARGDRTNFAEIRTRNNAVDDQLGALNDKVRAAIEQEQAKMARTADVTR